MARVAWTHRARYDLRRLIDYIAADSPAAARRFARRLIQKVRLLRIMPLMGAAVPEDVKNVYREVLHGNYRIIYRVERDVVYIATIHHGARLLHSDELSQGSGE